MATVYILYSKEINRFYIGRCLDFEKRLLEHRDHTFNGFTSRAKDWDTYFVLYNLKYEQARNIENHIKRMKSAVYIKNLVKYPKISDKLLILYS